MITDQLSHQESGGSNPFGHQPLPCDSIRDPFWDGENVGQFPQRLGWLISDLQGDRGSIYPGHGLNHLVVSNSNSSQSSHDLAFRS